MPRFYSTNRNLPGGFKESVGFQDALFMGQAPDEGLFMPVTIPSLPEDIFERLKGRPFRETAYEVMKVFLSEEIDHTVLREMTDDAYRFEIPLEAAAPGTWLMRLDQGPTASFKDVAALMLARLMAHFSEPGQLLTILVATSGDTGSAVGEAFRGVPGTRVLILYPRDEVSPSQKRQLVTIGGNVQAFEVDGKFDDCQRIVKAAFNDPELAKLRLTSANSINFGRILPQMTYYVHAYAQLAEPGEEVVFSVPSGNFGNALGCEFARRMGLPVKTLILATNGNDAFPRYLYGKAYEKVSPSRACLSNAMNVGHPSNLARLFDLYGGTVDKDGRVHRESERDIMASRIWSAPFSDDETRETMRRVHAERGIVLEPHGAVGWRGLKAYRDATGDATLGIVLETAHPAKFHETVREVLGIEPELPASMRDLASREGNAHALPSDYAAFKETLIRAAAGAHI